MTTTPESAAPLTEPIPVSSANGWREIGGTLAIRNYRFVISSMLAGSIGGWMSRVAQDWIILDLTGSVTAVGLAVTVQFAPLVFFGLWGGKLSDRLPRVPLIRIAVGLNVLTLAGLTCVVITGSVQLWHVYLASAVAGAVSVVEGPARIALLTQIVPPARLPAALGLNATIFHSAALIGSAAAGPILAFAGAPWALGVALVLGAASWVTLMGIRTRELSPIARGGVPTDIASALRYAVRKPTIRFSLLLIVLISAFGMTHTVLLAAAARDIGFNTGPSGYSTYLALAAVGAMVGALLSIMRRTVSLRLVVFTAIVFGGTMLAASAAPAEALFLVAIPCYAALRVLVVTASEALIQLTCNPAYRGRVAALYLVVVGIGQTVGGVLVGWLAETFGLAVAFAIAGALPLIAAVTLALWLAKTRRLRVRVQPLRNWSRGVAHIVPLERS